MASELFNKVDELYRLLVNVATSGYSPDSDKRYQELRSELCKTTVLKNLLPSLVAENRNLMDFWQFIKGKLRSYQERRDYLKTEFLPALNALEGVNESPIEFGASEMIKSYGENYIHDEWKKLLERKGTDHEGAITSARSLIETTCKHILEELGIEVSRKENDLPALYKMVAKALNLSPNQHSEQIFIQILSGCNSVIEGLGALRNDLGDSHGKGKLHVKPSKRHADLAINLAGTMTTFLLETFNEMKKKKKE